MTPNSLATNKNHLTQVSYATDERLRVRIQTHELYSQPAVDFPNWVLDKISWDNPQLVVDVGCGAGVYARPVQERGATYVAGDLSWGMVSALAVPGRLNLDVQQLPLADETVDVVLANHMLYHVPNQPQALAEIRRVLRPGGVLLAATNSRFSMQELDELRAAAGRPYGVELATMTSSDHFALEDGVEKLAPYFAQVVRYDLTAALIFPHAQPILAYLDSMNDWYKVQSGGRVSWEQVRPEVERLLQAHFAQNDTFVVNKLSGVLVGHKAENQALISSKIAKVVTKRTTHEPKNDLAYWQTQSYASRLAALEQIRREYHQWRYGAEPRFQRVCTIIKPK